MLWLLDIMTNVFSTFTPEDDVAAVTPLAEAQ